MRRPDGRQLLDGYLREVDLHLSAGRDADRRDVIAELRDGLLEDAATHRRRGAGADAAMRAAIASFGTPRQVGAAHGTELGIRAARRSAWWVLGLLAGAWLTWELGYRMALGVPSSITPGSGARRHIFLIGTDLAQWLPAGAAAGAVGTLLVTGRFGARGRIGRHALPSLTACIPAMLGAHALAMGAILATGHAELWSGPRTAAVLVMAGLVGWALVGSARASRRLRASAWRHGLP